MTEIFTNITDEMKSDTENAWNLARTMLPEDAVKFLEAYTGYFGLTHTDEETDFVRFYFNLKMEELKGE